MKTFIKLIIATQLLLVGFLCSAQIPETQHSQGISYITGGVGEEEATAILAEAKQWPLMLELSQIENGRGIWIFGANIKVMSNSRQRIFEAQAQGPFMLINLMPGEYMIEATYQDVALKRGVAIKADSPQKISIFWK